MTLAHVWRLRSAPANCPEGTHVSPPTSERGPYPPAFFTWWRKNSLHSFPLGPNVERAFPTVNLGSELLKLSSHPYSSLPTFETTVSPKQDTVGSLLPGLSHWDFGSGYFVFSNLSVSAPPSWSQLPWRLRQLTNLSAMWETQVRSLGWEDPLEKGTETAPLIFLPGESHGRRSLGVGGATVHGVANSWAQLSD